MGGFPQNPLLLLEIVCRDLIAPLLKSHLFKHHGGAVASPNPLCCFVLHIDLFTHSADMLAQGPSSHLYSHSTHGTLMTRLADRFTGFTVNTSHQGQSILQSSILAYWTLSGIDPGTKSTTSTTTGYQFPSGIGTPAVCLNLW